MFRACHAHHQEKQIVLTLNLLATTIVAPPRNANKRQIGFNSALKGLIQLLVIVTPCWWQCRVLVGSKLFTPN